MYPPCRVVAVLSHLVDDHEDKEQLSVYKLYTSSTQILPT